jgi:L-threonylcarbamoyladenylate synthase
MITKNIQLAVQELIEDNIIAIPTETVYGLAGNAFSESAIHKIFELKKKTSTQSINCAYSIH